MALISLQQVNLGFGGPPLLDEIDLQIERGETIGLLGRNGMGKTTLLRLLYGELSPESGVISYQQNLRLAYLPQEVPHELHGEIRQIVASGLEMVSEAVTITEVEEEWQRQLRVDNVIDRMQLEPAAGFESLSAGLKRRVLLARELARQPDLLLLDEPTNHLDIDAITWLEDFLARWTGTLLFVTHDRKFLQRLASRILELDRGRLLDWKCSYPVFLQRKAAMLEAEKEHNVDFDKKLAQEEQWIRRGIEARRTRNEGRVRALLRLRQIRDERRRHPGKARLQIQEARRSGKLVIEAQNVHFAFGEKVVVEDFSTTIQRGDRLGIVGPNGSGKTTLLRLLMGELTPQAGKIRLGTHLEAAYYDQLRAQLDEDKSVMDNLGQGGDTVTVNGKVRSLYGYLEDFLFSPPRARAPLRILSGGERNRLLLARLFAHPANLLVLDEPTNDLDLETLELLEDLLLDFGGTVLLVSHDRAFLNNLATSLLVLDGTGQVREYVGGYDDWLEQKSTAAITAAAAQAGRADKSPGKASRNLTGDRPAAQSEAQKAGPTRLSYHERRQMEADRQELADMPGRIESLEAEQQRLSQAMADPAFYQRDPDEIAQTASRLKELEGLVSQAYQRWEELEQTVGTGG